jgi:triacylglycerol lipase
MTAFRLAAATAATIIALAAGAAQAQVPPDIAAKLRAMGPTIDLRVGELYAPLKAKEPYAGVTVVRDVAYGPDPLQKVDVFSPMAGGKLRPVLLFVHGGGFVRGDKRQTDNMLVWGVDHGMVGVNLNYRLAPKDPWPAGAQDLASAIAWTKANIARYGGDPGRIFLWGHSAGANHVADYVAHPELQGPNGPGVVGAVLMSGIYDPMTAPNAYYGNDPATVAGLASKPGLLKTRVHLMVINAELDPPVMVASGKALNEDLCKAGRCPAFLLAKDHDHLSEGMAVGTADESVSGPVLEFIQTTP